MFNRYGWLHRSFQRCSNQAAIQGVPNGNGKGGISALILEADNVGEWICAGDLCGGNDASVCFRFIVGVK